MDRVSLGRQPCLQARMAYLSFTTLKFFAYAGRGSVRGDLCGGIRVVKVA
jgi:hypothetical protein